ncbi:hypothetical protein LTR47_012022, partial [Exophiala xenobiotica]
NLLKSLSTGFGGIGGASNGYGYGSSTRSRHLQDQSHNGFQLSMLRTKNKSAALPSIDDGSEEYSDHAKVSMTEQLRGAPTTSTMVQWSGGRGPNGETTSINSDESQRYMIRQDVQWEIRTEPRD